MTRLLPLLLLTACVAAPTWGVEWQRGTYAHRAPLTVATVGDCESSVRRAAQWWTDSAGFELWRLGDDPARADAVVRCGGSSRGNAVGTTWHERRGYGGRLVAVVQLHASGDALPVATLAHELGHAAGLAHDDVSATSIMRPVVPELPGGLRLADEDRDALAERYR